MSRVKIVTFVPTENADDIRRVLGEAGAGKLGKYTFCSYSVTGIGRFLPSQNANPHIGEPGKLESVQEERIEVICNREDARAIVKALKQAHPYEEVALDVMELIDEDKL